MSPKNQDSDPFKEITSKEKLVEDLEKRLEEAKRELQKAHRADFKEKIKGILHEAADVAFKKLESIGVHKPKISITESDLTIVIPRKGASVSSKPVRQRKPRLKSIEVAELAKLMEKGKSYKKPDLIKLAPDRAVASLLIRKDPDDNFDVESHLNVSKSGRTLVYQVR